MPKIFWTTEKIKQGILRFKEETGRLPTAVDYDKCLYLPSARHIQQSLGGLVRLREELEISGPFDFTKGIVRSEIAAKIFKNARNYEEDFYSYLTTILPEVRIHEQKRLRPGNVACDFFIYTTKTKGFAIDLFYADNIDNANKIINIKRKRYDIELDACMGKKKFPLLKHVRVYTEKTFKNSVGELITSL